MANLRGAFFGSASIRKACFRRADLRGADFFKSVYGDRDGGCSIDFSLANVQGTSWMGSSYWHLRDIAEEEALGRVPLDLAGRRKERWMRVKSL